MAKNRITFAEELVLRNGNVGIGTSNPVDNLDVRGTAKVTGSLAVTGNLQFGGISPIGDISSLYKEHAAEGKVPYSNVVSREGDSIGGIGFNTTGTTAYVLTINDDKIHQYSLSTPWYLSSGTKVGEKALNSLSFNVDNCNGINIGPNEDKIYIYSSSTRRLVEIDLLTPGDIVTAGIATFYDGDPINYSGYAVEGFDLSDDGKKIIFASEVGGREIVSTIDVETAFDYGSISGITSSLWIPRIDLTPSALTFSSDGTKAYICGDQRNRLLEYNLSTPWKIQTGVYQNIFINLGVNPTDVKFKTDGTLLFVTSGSSIKTWTLSTPWDLSTASASSTYSVAAQESAIRGIDFKPDGGRFYIVGDRGIVHDYSLGSAWNLGTLLLEGSLEVGTFVNYNAGNLLNENSPLSLEGNIGVTTQKAIGPRGLGISTDGTKIFVGDAYGDYITQWDLGTPWIASSGVSTVTTQPVVGVDFNSFTFDPTGTKLYSTDINLSYIQEYNLSTPWDLTTTNYSLGIMPLRSKIDAVRGAYWGDNGNKVYVVSSDFSGIILQYKLSVPYDISTMVYDTKIDRNGPLKSILTGGIVNITFSYDGSKIILSESTSRLPYTFELSTPWDIGTIKELNDDSFGSVALTYINFSFDFSADGTKIYTLDRDSNYLVEYILETPWDFSKFSTSTFAYIRYANKTNSFNSRNLAGYDRRVIKFRRDGRKLWIYHSYPQYEISAYELLNPWDISTLRYLENESIHVTDLGIPLIANTTYTEIEGFDFDLDGYRFYVQDNALNKIYQLDLTTPWDLTTAKYTDKSISSQNANNYGGITISRDGFVMYIGNSPYVYEYNLTTPWELSSATLTDRYFDASEYDVNFRNTILRSNNSELFVGGGSQYRIFRFKFDVKKVSINADIVLTGNVQVGEGIHIEGKSNLHKAEFTQIGIGQTVSHKDFSTDLLVARNSDLKSIGSKKDISKLKLKSKANKFYSLTRDRQGSSQLYAFTSNADGTRLYTIGRANGSNVNQELSEYKLSTAWDIDTIYEYNTISLRSYGGTTDYLDMVFKPDGTKLYAIKNSGNSAEYQRAYVDQYDLSTAWDIGTLKREKTYYVGNQSGGSRSIQFSTDGTKLFTFGQDQRVRYGEVNQYDLSVAWDIETAVHKKTLGPYLGYYTAGQYGTVFRFKPDGTEFFIGSDNAGTYTRSGYPFITLHYKLDTPWDLSTAKYSQDYTPNIWSPYEKDGSDSGFGVARTFSFIFKPDGKKVFTTDYLQGVIREWELEEAWNIYTIKDTPTLANFGSRYPRLEYSHDGSFVYYQDAVNGRFVRLNLKTPYDFESVIDNYNINVDFLSTPTFNWERTYSLRFGDNGTKLYYTGAYDRVGSSARITQFDLDTPYQIDTATITKNKKQFALPINYTFYDSRFSPDGKKLIALTDQGKLFGFDVPEPWNIDSIDTDNTFGITLSYNELQTDGHVGWDFNDDGTELYFSNYSYSQIDKLYLKSEPYNITENYVEKTEKLRLQTNIAPNFDNRGIVIGSGGTSIYAVNRNDDHIYQIGINTTNFAESTFSGKFYVGSQEANPEGVAFKSDGTRMYVVGRSNDRVQQYDLSVAWDITTATFVDNYFPNVNGVIGSNDLYSIGFSSDGTQMYVGSGVEIGQFELSTPWDATTATHIGRKYNIPMWFDRDSYPQFLFSSDGTILYVTSARRAVFKYNLSTAWDIRTAKIESPKLAASTYLYGNDINWGEMTSAARTLHFEENGLTAYIEYNNDGSGYYNPTQDGTLPAIVQYDLTRPWDVTTAGFTTFFTFPTSGFSGGLFHPNKKDLYYCEYEWSSQSSYIHRYENEEESTLNVISETSFHSTVNFDYGINSKGYSNFGRVGIGSTSFGRSQSQLVVTGNIETDSVGNDMNLNSARLAVDEQLKNGFDFFGSKFVSGVGKYFLSDENAVTGKPSLFGFTLSDDGKYLFGALQTSAEKYNAVIRYELETEWDITTGITTSFKFVSVNDSHDFAKIRGNAGLANTDASIGVAGVRGIGFGSDGKYMYVTGYYQFNGDGSIASNALNGNSKVVQYTLDTKWDPTTINVGLTTFIRLPNYLWDGNSSNFAPGNYPRIPNDLKFNPSGDKMFIINENFQRVFQFDLSTPWQIGSASTITKASPENYNASYTTGFDFINSKEILIHSADRGLTKVGLKTDYEIDSSIRFGQNATYENWWSYIKFSPEIVGGNAYSIGGFKFSADGKRFYVGSYLHGRLYQIDLTEPYNLSSMYVKNKFDSSLAWSPSAPFYRNLWESSSMHYAFYEYGFTFSGDGKTFVHTLGNGVIQRKLDKPYNFDTDNFVPIFFGSNLYAEQSQAKVINLHTNNNSPYHYSSPHTSLRDLKYSHDGKYFFTYDQNTTNLTKYRLDEPWDVNTYNYVESLTLYPYGLGWDTISFEFGNKGKTIVFGSQSKAAPFQFTLDTPYDLSTAKLNDDSFPVRFENANFDYYTNNSTPNTEDSEPSGLFFKPDGKRIFIVGDGRNAVYQLELSKAWEIQTAGPGLTTYFSISSEGTDPRGMKFSTDGTEMYIAQWNNRTIDQYTLSSAWDLSTTSFTASYSTTSPLSYQPYDMDFNEDGTKMIIASSNSAIVYGYNLSVAWDVTSATYADESYDFYYFGEGGTERTTTEKLRSTPTGIHFSRDGYNIYYREGNYLRKVPLREAWNISSVYWHNRSDTRSISGNEYIGNFSLYHYGLGSSNKYGLYIKPGEDKFYVISAGGLRGSIGYFDRIFQFKMDTPGYIDAAYQVNQAFAWNWHTNNLEREIDCLRFHPNGYKLYASFGNRENLFTFKLTRQWDITSARWDGDIISFSELARYSANVSRIRKFEFTDSGSRLAFVTNGNNYRGILFAEIDDSKRELNITSNANISGKLEVSSTLIANSEVKTPKVDTNSIVIGTENTDQSSTGLVINNNAEIYSIGSYPDATQLSTENISVTSLRGFTKKIRSLNTEKSSYKDINWKRAYSVTSQYGFSSSDYGKYTYSVGYDRNESFITQLEFENREIYNIDGVVDIKVADITDEYFRENTIGIYPRVIESSNDGVNLYISSNDVGIGTSGVVKQFVMSTPHDLTTVGYSTSFDFNLYETRIEEIKFNPDGTKVYICGTYSDKISEFDLSSAWDISTAGFSTDLTTSTVNPYSFAFGNDGNKLITSNGSSLDSYTLGTPWNVDTAVLDNVGKPTGWYNHIAVLYTLAPGSTQFLNVEFSRDGKKLFVGSEAYGYERVTLELETPWEIASAKPSKNFLSSYRLFGGLSATGSQPNNVPGSSGPEIIRFSPDGKHGYVLHSRGSSYRLLCQVFLEEPYQIASARLVSLIDLSNAGLFRIGSADENTFYVTGFDIKPDGRRLYFTTNGSTTAGYQQSSNHIEYLDLNVPWDITSYRNSVGINTSSEWYWFDGNTASTTRQSNIYSLQFKPDGTSFYVSDLDGGASGMYQYNMEVPWEINTASPALERLSTFDQETGGNSRGIYVSPDNTKVFMVGTGGDAVYRYDIPEKYAGNVSKAVWSGISTSFTALDSDPTGIFMKPDGMKMFISGDAANAIHEFDLSVAWDVSTAVYSQSLDVSTYIADPQEVRFTPDGKQLFVLGYSGAYLVRYKLSTAWDVSSATFDIEIRMTPQPFTDWTKPHSFDFSSDGKTLVLLDGNEYYNGDLYTVKLRRPYEITEIESIEKTAWMPPYYYVQNIMQRMQSVFFNKTGNKLYMLDDGLSNNYTADILTYTLEKPYDASSGYWNGYKNFVYAGPSAFAFRFSSDGLNLLAYDAVNLFGYKLEEAWKPHTIRAEQSLKYNRLNLNAGSNYHLSSSYDLRYIYFTSYSGSYRVFEQIEISNLKPVTIRNELHVNSDLKVLQNANVGGLTIQSPTINMPAAGIGTTESPGVLIVNSKGTVSVGRIDSDKFFTPPVLGISSSNNNIRYFDTRHSLNERFHIDAYPYGAVLHPNGMIYAINGSSGKNTYLKINPNTGENIEVGTNDDYNRGSSSYYGAIVHPNGKIYSPGYDRPRFQVFDPTQNTVDTIEIENYSINDTANNYVSCCLGRNNKIYAMPYTNSSAILEFDPVTGIATHYDTGVSGNSKYYATVLGGNGKIYGIPYNATVVAELDPETGTVVTFGSISGGTKYIAGTLAPNGKIYCAPWSSSQVLEIDCENRTASLIGPTLTYSGSNNRWRKSTLAPNGKIYALPYSYGSILEIDPLVGTASTVGVTSHTYYGSILSPNGKIFGLPSNQDAIMEFTPPNIGINTVVGYTTSYQNAPWIYSAYTNHY